MPKKVPDNQGVDLSEFEALRSSLGPESEAGLSGEVAGLHYTAEALLEQAGKETTINGLAGVATPQSYQVRMGEVPMYARLGRLAPGKSQTTSETDPPKVIFCTTSDFNRIRTPNIGALSFTDGLYGPQLIAVNGTEPVIDDPKYIELTKTIVADLSRQYDETKQRERANKSYEARRKQARRETRMRIVGGLAVAGLLLYGQPIAEMAMGKHIDAKLGPVPMPAPVEWVVDMAHIDEHEATAFGKPDGALPLEVGATSIRIPVISNYDTGGVPDASYVRGNGDSNGGVYVREQVDLGLWRSNFSFDDPSSDNKNARPDVRFDPDGCYNIYGNYSDGKSSVFSQTPNINNLVELDLVNASTLKVCKKPDAPDHSVGDIDIYREFDS